MKQLQIFNFEHNEVRTTTFGKDNYFMLGDVCKVLDLNNVSQVKNRLKQDGVITNEVIDSLGRKQQASFVNESNLYKVIFQSKKPNAERFTDWVTEVVLPAIRQTGSYTLPSDPMDVLKLMFEATEQTQKEVKHVTDRVQTLEEDFPLSSSEYGYIARRLNAKVMEFVEIRNLEENNDAKKILFKDINSGIHAIAGVMTRSQLRNRHFTEVLNYVRDWMPSQSTLILIDRME